MEFTYCFTISRFGKQWLAGTLPGLVLALALSACAVLPESSEDGVASEQMKGQAGQSADADSGEAQPTSDEVLYRVLAGELQGTDGDLEKAAEEYLAAALESDDPEIAQRATQVALAAQAWQYAAMAADRWVVLAPDDLEALETAARALLLAGDYVGAEHHLSTLLTVHDEDPMQGWSTVARLLSSARHTELTDRILQRLIEDHNAGGNPYALFAQSQVAARTGDLNRAAALAELSVKGAPDKPELHAWAGRVAVNQGRQELALKHYKTAWELVPDNRVHALLYAELLRQSGALDHANAVLAGLEDTAENRFTRIAFALQTGDRELAELLYRGFETASYTNRGELAIQAARSAELLEWPEEAIRWYEQIEGGEDGLVALGRRAFLYAELGRIDEARKVLAQARESAAPEMQIESLALESQILIEAHQPDQAYQVLSDALQQFPGDSRLMYTRGLVAVELDRLDIAERDLQQVIARDPENAAALNALGYTLADRTERLEEAEQLISEAYRLEPDEASIIDSMGWVAYRLGRLDEAEAYLRQAFARQRNAEIAAHLGEVLWVSGSEDDAREIWNAGLEIDAANKVLIETLTRFGITP